MSTWVALLLGAVNGFYEFIPVSSSSHLALLQHWLQDWGVSMPDPESDEMILFDLVVHVGTVVSIVIVMWGRLVQLARDVVDDIHSWRVPRDLPALHFVVLLAISTWFTGVVGLVIRETASDAFGEPVAVAVLLLLTGVVLWWTDRANPEGLTKLSVGIAVGIGLAQALALLPGLSRSGMTIAAALAFGLWRKTAAEYSFFLAIPTILLATAVEAVSVSRDGPLEISLYAYAAGFAMSALVGVFSLIFVLKLLYAARFRIFSIYVVALAAVVLLAGVSTPTR